MLIDALHPEETRVVIADERQIYDFDFISTAKKQLKGNIYLAKITRVEPSLQAAFVEYGGNKQGFLPFSEIHADYYQIPMADRQRLMEEAERESAAEETRQPSAHESYGEQPITEMPQELPAPEVTGNTDMPELPLPAMGEESSHPAYLTQGAIDVSISEEVLPPAMPEMPDMGDEAAASDMIIDQKPEEQHVGEMPAETASADSAAQNEGVETIPSEEEEYRPKKHIFSRRYKIQEVIRRGQIVLVQVIKEERGNKGVSLTTYLSLAGRYCVLMPNSPKDGGISRKIAGQEDRKRLKSIYTELKLAAGMSVIIRTAGMDRTRAEIKRDYDYLVKLWNQIREDTLKSNAPALIYEESDIIKRAIRDQYSNDIDELVIEGDEGYAHAKDFMKMLLPSHTGKVRQYSEPTPLFYAYNVEEQLLSMHDPAVKLRSGGYIVMNPTEALISIDVNSGRATGERNIEETATKTNLEAAAEIARQLRLRDLAGLIVIDFIDMMESRNRRAVEKALKDALKADRAKIQIGRISPFGLLEMSRQRLRSSISETNMVQCPHCMGRGVIRSNESMSIQMIRAIEKEASTGSWSSLRLVAPQVVALHLLNNKRDILRAIENRYSITVQVVIGVELSASEFNLEKMRRSERGDRNDRGDRGDRGDRNERSERSERSDRGDRRRHDRDRPDRGERQDRNQEAATADTMEMEAAGNDNVAPPSETSDEQQPREDSYRRGRGRNRRGRGPRRDRNDRGDRDRQNNEPAVAADVQQDNAVDGNVVEDASAPSERQDQPGGRNPRGRGGRGRRRWRDDRGKGDDRGRNKNRDGDYAPRDREHVASDGNSLPAFATENPVPVESPAPRAPEPVAQAPLESTPRDPNAPPKKGWWKKMIELDD
jgi:ribonuclease E